MNGGDVSRRAATRLLAQGAASAILAPALWSAVKGDGTMQNRMLQRAIPSSGEKIPIIGLGTWQVFDVGAGEAERRPLAEVLSGFAALGGRVVDSSPMYGRAEQVVGDLAANLKLRDSLFLATKVWTNGKQQGIASMERSLAKMQTNQIDLMQVHNLVDARTHLPTLRQWKEQT